MATIWKPSRANGHAAKGPKKQLLNTEIAMPVKLSSKSTGEPEARIEIMFFLLASFMLVSLSMVNLKTVKVNLPTATTATPDISRDLISLTVDKNGMTYLGKQPIGVAELAQRLSTLRASGANPRVLIGGDQEARHGDVMRVLDAVRSAGIDRVAFEIRDSQPVATNAP
jgi:biopolymer transport protein ExbD